MRRKLNLSPTDRTLRVLIGGILVYLGFFEQTIISNDVLRILLGLFGAINIAAALYGVCPIYKLANLSTYKQRFDESTFSENPDVK